VLSRGSGAHCSLRASDDGPANMGRLLGGFENFYGQAMAVRPVAVGSGGVAGQGGIQENRMGEGVVGWGPPCLGGWLTGCDWGWMN
jgi:hypothetical protein